MFKRVTICFSGLRIMVQAETHTQAFLLHGLIFSVSPLVHRPYWTVDVNGPYHARQATVSVYASP